MDETSDSNSNSELDLDTLQQENSNTSDKNACQTNSNINSDDIDAEEAKKLRGDAIGNTMYSESFVVELLLQLQDLKWSKKMEEDFCFLWDMAVEKEVCDYLLTVIYSSVASHAVKQYTESRLVEILIGIMANICCTASDLSQIRSHEIEDFLLFLESDDPLILIQVVRLLKAAAFRNIISRFNESMFEHLNFILVNSLNCELLLATLDAVSTITGDGKVTNKSIKGDLLNSCVVAHQSIAANEQNEDVEDKFVTEKVINSFTNLTKITCNLCSLIDGDNSFEGELKQHVKVFVEEVAKMFISFSLEDNLSVIWLELQFYFDACVYIFPLLNIDFHFKLFKSLIKITNNLLKSSSEELCSLLELNAFFINKGSLEEVKMSFYELKPEDSCKILTKLLNPGDAYDSIYARNVNVLLEEFKNKC